MIDDNQLDNGICVPAELQQRLPRRVRLRLGARGIYYLVGDTLVYLVGDTLVSIAIAALIIVAGSLTPKEIKERNELKREGSLTYTNDVQVGGGRSSTVFFYVSLQGTKV